MILLSLSLEFCHCAKGLTLEETLLEVTKKFFWNQKNHKIITSYFLQGNGSYSIIPCNSTNTSIKPILRKSNKAINQPSKTLLDFSEFLRETFDKQCDQYKRLADESFMNLVFSYIKNLCRLPASRDGDKSWQIIYFSELLKLGEDAVKQLKAFLQTDKRRKDPTQQGEVSFRTILIFIKYC